MKVEFPLEEDLIPVNQVDRHEQLYHSGEIHNAGKKN